MEAEGETRIRYHDISRFLSYYSRYIMRDSFKLLFLGVLGSSDIRLLKNRHYSFVNACTLCRYIDDMTFCFPEASVITCYITSSWYRSARAVCNAKTSCIAPLPLGYSCRTSVKHVKLDYIVKTWLVWFG